MRGRWPAAGATGGLVLILLAAWSAPAQTPVESALKQRIDQLRTTGTLEIGGAVITRSTGVVELYEEMGFTPLWTDAGPVRDLDRLIRESAAEGLDPSLYGSAAMKALGSIERPTPDARALLDLLRSAALLRLAHDFRYGRTHSRWDGFGSESGHGLALLDGAGGVRETLRRSRLHGEVRALLPDHPVYRGLVAALAGLRGIEAAGGWDSIPAGPALARDSVGARVALLRRRLALEGYPATSGANAAVFEAGLDAAVRSFQHTHGLNEDGVVGRATLAELDVPVGTRIDQVRINLERARWVTHDLPATFLTVNIAGARVYLIRDGSVIFESRVIVGKTGTRTPVFRATARYVDLNPTWTVPPGIVGEVLAEVRRNPGYLPRNGFQVLDRAGGAVDPARVDFSRYSARSFPYVFRQGPGPTNPLGRVKIVFPNPHNVYLHDTPARALFQREERLFSHGCIRVQDPLTLAELVLDDPAAWSRAAMDSVLARGRTRTVPLARPLPVLILYWTAATDLHGELHFYRDVYGRDPALLAALNAP